MKLSILITLLMALAGRGFAQETQSEKERVQRILRQAIDEKERDAARHAALTNQTLRADPNFRAAELRYLNGEISAKEFRRYLQDYQPPLRIAPLVTNTPAINQAVELLRKHDPAAPNPGRPPKPFGTESPVETNAPSVDLEDLETKMNRLVESQKKRHQTDQLDASKLDQLSPTSGLPARERLNLLLRLYIEGVITEPEYRVHREKILSEPAEPKPEEK